MRRTNLVTALLGLVVFAVPLTASAQNGLPLKYSERPLTITEGTIAIQGAFDYLKLPTLDLGPLGSVTPDPIISFVADVSYGISDDFEANIIAVPVVLSPDTKYGNPVLSGTFRFLKTAVELGVHAGFVIPVQSGSNFQLNLGVPALFGLTDTTKILSGLYFNLDFGDSTIATLRIPIEFAVNLTPQFFLDVFTGISMFDVDPDNLAIPLGVGLGYTLAASADSPLADLFVRFQFPAFLNASGDTVVTDVFEFQLGARFFLN